jgi:hypothetical protein
MAAAGLLFPATGYAGFTLTMVLPGCLAAFPKQTFVGAILIAVGCNSLHPMAPKAPEDCQGIDTQYGGIAHEQVDSVSEHQIAQDVQAPALASKARVIVFPESVVPRWTPETDLFLGRYGHRMEGCR